MNLFFRNTALLALSLGAFSALARAADRQVLPGHIPAEVSRLTPIKRLGGSNCLKLAIGLPLRNQAALTEMLREIYDPKSPNYRHFLSPKQFTEKFAPTEEDYQILVNFAKSNSLSVTARHPNRMLIEVSGLVADIEKTFHITMLVYPHPTESRTFYAPDAEPSVDLEIPLAHVVGLDDYALPHPAGLRAAADLEGGPVPNAGSGPNGAYLGDDFRTAYAPGVTLAGTGQSVGLLEFDGYYTNDIVTYESEAGLTNVNVTNVLLDTFNGIPGPDNYEVALDIELATAMAPQLSKVIVYESGLPGSADVILNRMATDDLANQLSSSWTWGGGNDPIANQIFQELAAQGQSFFNACGDGDAYSGAIPFPADNPYITIVGGTTLSTGQGGSWSSESAWNMGNGQGTGGGISPNYLIPVWQQGLAMTTNQGSTNYRNIPDVSAVANNIWVVYNNGESNSFAGTSCAAPLWAGFAALINQQAAFYGQPPVGFLNPALYAIGRGTNYPACFHDITTGNNTNSSSPSLFFAVPSYDLCTGWGSPVGQSLINALEPPDYLVVSPQVGFAANGLPGGAFNSATQTFLLTNHGPDALTWTAASTAPWLAVSTNSGSLLEGGPPAQVAVSLSFTAFTLPAGDYSAGIIFSNQTTGVTREPQFSLHIAESLVLNGGFETGDLSDWTLDGSPFGNTVSSGSPVAPHSGSFAAALGEYGSLAYVSQTLPTVAGQTYLLSFWFENLGAATTNQYNQFLVNWNTNTVYNETNLGAFGWSNLQFVVTAAGSDTVLQFGAQNDPSFFGLDDIAVTPVPIPSLVASLPAGGGIAFSWSTFPGLVYQVQYRTNLDQAIWQNLGGPAVATGGTMSVSDFLDSGPQRFYRVLMLP